MKELPLEGPDYKCAFCRKVLAIGDEAFFLEHKADGIVDSMFVGRFCSSAHLLRYVMNDVVATFIANGMPPAQARQIVVDQLGKDPLIN